MGTYEFGGIYCSRLLVYMCVQYGRAAWVPPLFVGRTRSVLGRLGSETGAGAFAIGTGLYIALVATYLALRDGGGRGRGRDGGGDGEREGAHVSY